MADRIVVRIRGVSHPFCNDSIMKPREREVPWLQHCRADQSRGLASIRFRISSQFVRSDSRYSCASFGVVGSGWLFIAAIRLLMSGRFKISTTVLLSLSIISGGVPALASKTYQEVMLKLSRPASFMVGTS